MRFAAPVAFRRFALLLALILALAQCALFGFLWRLGVLVEPTGNPRAALGFVVLGSALTLQAMAVVGVAWTVVAMSRTTAEGDDESLTLEHPWRRWHGGWPAVRHAWQHNGWLTVEVDGQWRRWYIRLAPTDDHTLVALRERLAAGAWLEGPALRAHYLRSVLSILLAAVGLGGLLLVIVLRYLNRTMSR